MGYRLEASAAPTLAPSAVAHSVFMLTLSRRAPVASFAGLAAKRLAEHVGTLDDHDAGPR
jgi:hypothetical protein